ncbi:MAG: hypothetical protein ACREJC_00130, partial [Tepidisphaeraceae bacterium]
PYFAAPTPAQPGLSQPTGTPPTTAVKTDDGLVSLPPATVAAVTGIPTPIPTQWFGWKPSGGGTTIRGIGITDATVVSLGAAVANNNQTTGSYVQVTGDGLNGRGAVEAESGATVQVRQEPTIEFEVITGPDLTALRIWIELTDQANGSANSDTAGGSTLAFNFSTVVGGSSWTALVRDGATQAARQAVAPIAASTYYKLKIRVASSIAYFSVNGGVEVSFSANLPAAATNLRPNVVIHGTVGNTDNKAISVGAMWASYGL